jgi:hypothetical protein
MQGNGKVIVKLRDIIGYLEGHSNNTDTDSYWIAATALRKCKCWESAEWLLPSLHSVSIRGPAKTER